MIILLYNWRRQRLTNATIMIKLEALFADQLLYGNNLSNHHVNVYVFNGLDVYCDRKKDKLIFNV